MPFDARGRPIWREENRAPTSAGAPRHTRERRDAPVDPPYRTTDLRGSRTPTGAIPPPEASHVPGWLIGAAALWVLALVLVVAGHAGRAPLRDALVVAGGLAAIAAGAFSVGRPNRGERATAIAAGALALAVWTTATVLHVTAP